MLLGKYGEIMDKNFWKKKRVLITGHTGFKGSWMSFWLNSLGAEITGYSIDIPTSPSLFEVLAIRDITNDIRGDVRDLENLRDIVEKTSPEVVFHLAAQPLVLKSYMEPVLTFSTNIMGTVNLLESVRGVDTVKACVIVSSDKCYKNKEKNEGYFETDEMGGYDPYSSSKGCTELITESYRKSFFYDGDFEKAETSIASARAGNVIGGGDWAEDRLVPDCIEALQNREAISLRKPQSIRPWQHVLEPLNGYMLLAEKMFKERNKFSKAYNFGPSEKDCISVDYLVKRILREWGESVPIRVLDSKKTHEAELLKLDTQRVCDELKWKPVWNIERAIEKTVEWYKAYYNDENMKELTRKQIETFTKDGLLR